MGDWGRGSILALALALVATTTAAAATATAPSGPFTRAGRFVVDRQGRVVVLHGFDIVKKAAPFYPSGFTASDADFLAGEGVTTARVGFIWEGVEPTPGHYDDAYIHHVVDFVSLLESRGIQPLIDFHQDTWGTEGFGADQCRSDGLCWIGSGDGAPAWADLGTSADDNFEHFWKNDKAPDGVGLQTHFVNAWRHVVGILDASPASAGVLGLDPLNEPYPGSGYASPCGDFSACPAFEKTQLHNFYARVITALRRAGDRHMIFPEGIAQNAQQEPSLPAFADRRTGFNWHYYCTASQLTPDVTGALTSQYCGPVDATAFSNVTRYADGLGVPWLVSEFGGSDSSREYGNEVDWMGSHFLSWMEWMYYQAATDPANLPGQGLLTVDAAGGSEGNADQDKLDALVVPYAEAIAGTPESYAFDRSSATMTLKYLAQPLPGARLAPGALTRIFVPSRQYPLGFTVTAHNGRVVQQSGQWVDVAANDPGDEVTVTVASSAPAAP